MSIATKTATVLLATTALCGIGSVAAAAYADAPATSTASHPAGGSQIGTRVVRPLLSRSRWNHSGAPTVSATVTTADGTATADDYLPLASTLSFPAARLLAWCGFPSSRTCCARPTRRSP